MDINDFCNKDDIREYLHTPFNVADKTVATDGYVLLCVPRIDDYKENNNQEKLNETVNGILSDLKNITFESISDVKIPEKEECFRCKGTKKAKSVPCEECDGEGEAEAETDYNTYPELTCKSCGGNGYIVNFDTETDCEECNGEGKRYPNRIPIEICGINVDLNLLDKVKNKKNIQFSGIPDKYMLAFKFGEKSGVIMAMRI